jgi:hypothetical protein
MTSTRTEQILQVLFPVKKQNARSVWMILDGARDERIYRYLKTCNLDYLCLYTGKLPIELQYVAPYLLELPSNSKTARELIDMAWGNNWGIFLSIDDFSKLRPHLRKFLKVKDESGKKLLFRFYDPRVMRVFLPTCSSEQLREFFGPIAIFHVEDDHGSMLKSFSFDGFKVSQDLVSLD